MKRSTLELLCCPSCQAELTLRDESGNTSRNGGELFCSHCERSYIIKNGICTLSIYRNWRVLTSVSLDSIIDGHA